ncbi:tRNA N(3)-methylcytidine methyltransferase trm141-like isoform X2 [Typha angustifolia]|uniref:tRNA N(3)-methylcytidine methyltransferase trm141-like isoform X2 n=1 Tax=Typha angustifolia TaxID=59011 RepID=UPI003C2FDE34
MSHALLYPNSEPHLLFSLQFRTPPFLMISSSLLLHRRCFHLMRPPLHISGITSRPQSLFLSSSSHSSLPRRPELRKYERNPSKYWNDFYKRHHNKFFKDRHYLEKDWGRYFSSPSENREAPLGPKIVLEVGCGAGNTLFPLLVAFPEILVHACDFSPHAIELLKENGNLRSDQVNAFVCDVTMDNLCEHIKPASVDVVTMIFMLSAVPPVKMPLVLQNIKKVLKPNGYLLFRDYAMGDFAQLHSFFNASIWWFQCAFYFSNDLLSTLFERNGFKTVEINVYCKQIVNHLRNVVMNRRWIRGTFCNFEHPDIHQQTLADS